ncbi:uncharacterized protein TNCV_3422331 [Trichonephila clavipes]|nr:uncharacterized protein TNCV_3422331 [Trichonephila clavipes]
MVSFNLTIGAVEPHHVSQCPDPADDLDWVFFHPELPVHVNKQTDLPAYIKQLALERIEDIPIHAVQWIPSHIDLEGNEIADTLAQGWRLRGKSELSGTPHLFGDFLRTKHRIRTLGLPPEHHWYQCSRPGGSLAHGFTRQDQTLPPAFEVTISKQWNFPKDARALKCARTVLLSQPCLLTSLSA